MAKTEKKQKTKKDFSSKIGVSAGTIKNKAEAVKELLNIDGEIVALIKPQFEAGKGKVGKKGVVREKSTHIEVIEMVSKFAVETGFSILNLDYSPIKGPEGNIEYLIHLRNSNEGYTFNEEDYKQKIIKVVEDSHKLNH